MEKLFTLTGGVFPVPARFRNRLARDVAELSRLLTFARGERGAFYLDKSAMLTAYLRCFLPWNVYRLVRLLPSLPLALADGDTVTDLGSGPLTLPLALWIARPELRPLKLIFRCVDRSRAALDAGKKLFAALSSPDRAVSSRDSGSVKGGVPRALPETAWTIKTIKGDILNHGRRGGRGIAPLSGKSALVCAINVYNESFWGIPHQDSRALARFAEGEAVRLSEMSGIGASILVVEPGVPRSGEFITLLRDALTARGRPVNAPCPHSGPCPFPGGRERTGDKRKWCHFAFDTETAPQKLRSLSTAAGLPKEKAVLSFLFSGGAGEEAEAPDPSRIAVRALSDKFPITDGNAPGASFGRYGCSQAGAVLLAGTGEEMDGLPAGTLLRRALSTRENRDAKSGAFILELCGDL